MQKVIIDACKKCDCGDKRPIVNKTHYLCAEKNRERLDLQKSDSYKDKKKKSFITSSIKQKENVLLLKQVYDEIANEREHICEGCGTNKTITHSHTIPRSRRKDLELDKNNIVYLCMNCHWKWEHGTKKQKAELLNLPKMLNYIFDVDTEYFNLLQAKWQE